MFAVAQTFSLLSEQQKVSKFFNFNFFYFDFEQRTFDYARYFLHKKELFQRLEQH